MSVLFPPPLALLAASHLGLVLRQQAQGALCGAGNEVIPMGIGNNACEVAYILKLLLRDTYIEAIHIPLASHEADAHAPSVRRLSHAQKTIVEAWVHWDDEGSFHAKQLTRAIQGGQEVLQVDPVL